MKLKIKKHSSAKVKSRLKSKVRIRKKVIGTAERPRLCVFRSTSHIYAQLVNDTDGKTIVASSSLKVSGNGNCETAKSVGKDVAEKAKAANIDTVVFDRSGYVYHGRVKALADGAREAGLKF